MYSEFSIDLPTGETMKGCHWPTPDPKFNLVMQTGMNEHASRFEPMALYLNARGINVWILDAFGQGLNAKSVEEQEQWPEGAFFKNVDALHMQVEKVKKESSLPTVVMGHSMGSFMVQSYLERHPDTADKVVLFGTNGPVGIYPLAKFIAKLRVNKKNWNEPDKFLQNMVTGRFPKAVKNAKTDLDWLSYNEDNVKAYAEDPYCGHDNTKGFFLGFFEGLSTLYKGKNKKKISKKEHIRIMAGEEDPVGEMGKGPRRLYDMYKKLGVEDVSIIMYPKMRHEIHNETDKEKVFNDLANFITGQNV